MKTKLLFLITILLTICGSLFAQSPLTVEGTFNGITQHWTSGAAINRGQIVKLNSSGQAVPMTTTDTAGVLGVAVTSVNASGFDVLVSLGGSPLVQTDGACNVGDFVLISSTTAGLGHCSSSASGQVVGTAIQKLSTNGFINAQLSPLSSSAGGGGGGVNLTNPTASLPQPSHLIGAYWMLPSENPCAFVDYSGKSNTAQGCPGPNTPAIITGTGGVTCVWNGTPIKLPSALNSAQTIAAFVKSNGHIVNTLQFIVGGNGNLATGHYIALATTNNLGGAGSTGYNLGVSFGAYGDTTGGSGTLGASTNAPDYAPGLITMTNDGSDRPQMYWNGAPIFGNSTGIIMADQDRGNFQICGTAAGQGLNSNSYYNGNVYALFFWDTALTSAEISSVSSVVNAAMIARGLDLNACNTLGSGLLGGSGPTAGCASANPVVRIDGDSLFQGNPRGASFVANSSVSPIFLVNGAMSAEGLCSAGSAGKGSYAASAIAKGQFTPAIAGNAHFVWLGTDDNGSPTGNALSACMQQWAAINHTFSVPFIPVTMMDRSTPAGEEARKNSFNTSMRLNQFSFDAIADLAAWAVLGADSAAGNTTYFTDGVHLTNFANDNYVVPMLNAAYNHVWGAKDFSTATAYSSAAAAATATTAGSESGSTVTITFGATPANCQVPNYITIAGATPAGYNGTFSILTRTATQITYTNSATGLGAISVQGTGICPTQQDNDNYAILNFGAGNFFLQPCELWVGGSGAPDRKVHITNINAANSTIGTTLSETINGAATLTINAHTSVTLSANLVSSAAGGCTWVTQ